MSFLAYVGEPVPMDTVILSRDSARGLGSWKEHMCVDFTVSLCGDLERGLD